MDHPGEGHPVPPPFPLRLCRYFLYEIIVHAIHDTDFFPMAPWPQLKREMRALLHTDGTRGRCERSPGSLATRRPLRGMRYRREPCVAESRVRGNRARAGLPCLVGPKGWS